MQERKIIPNKITIKSKPHGQRNQLFVAIEHDSEKFSAFVTKDLCEIILGFLEKQEPMICDFEEGNLIRIKNCIEMEIKNYISDALPDFEGIPSVATFYSTRLKKNFYSYVQVEKTCLVGFMSFEATKKVVSSILANSLIQFKTEDDPRDNFRKLSQNFVPIDSDVTPAHIAYFVQ